MNARSRAPSSGSASRPSSIRAPSGRPPTRSLRYSPAQVTRPGSTGSSKAQTNFETPPEEVMITTMHDARLQRQHLDVADRRAVERRRRRDREQVRDLRQRLGGDAQRVVELAAHVRRGRARRGGAALLGRREQAVDEVALAGVGRQPPRRGVRVREQAAGLELRELVADRRGPAVEARGRRRASSTRPAGRSRRSSRRPCGGSSPGGA